MQGHDFFREQGFSKHDAVIKPLWVYDNPTSNKTIEMWFNEVFPSVQQSQESDILLMRSNLAWYVGRYDKTAQYENLSATGANLPLPQNRIYKTVNHLWRITEEEVSHMSRFRPAIVVVPHDTESSDASAARLSKLFIDQVFNTQSYVRKQEETDRRKKIFGESYLSVEWDPLLGDKLPGTMKFGNLEVTKMTGDVGVRVVEPFKLFPFPAENYSEVHTFVEIEKVMHFKEASMVYGKSIGLPDNASNKLFPYTSLNDTIGPEDVIVYRVVIAPNLFLPSGLVCRIINGKIVERSKKYPFTLGLPPYVRLTDLDTPLRLRGMSTYQNLIPMQHEYNKMTAMLLKNLYLTAHPKIMGPENSFKVSSMTNLSTAVTYRGPVAPKIAVFPASPPELYNFRDSFREEMGQIGASHGVSRGEPPPGIRAGIALQFLEEQERELRSVSIRKKNEFIREIARRVISTASDNLGKDEERIIRIVGINNQYELESIKGKQIAGNYTIEIQNGSALSESKSGKVAQLLEMRQTFGEKFLTDEIAADVLEFGQIEKALDIKTAALRAAQGENERMAQGKEIKSATQWEDLITHWTQHMIFIQSAYFKQNFTPETQDLFFEHIEETEIMMEIRSVQSITFGEVLKGVIGFPAFKNYSVIPVPVEGQSVPAGGGLQSLPDEVGGDIAPPPNGQLSPEQLATLAPEGGIQQPPLTEQLPEQIGAQEPQV